MSSFKGRLVAPLPPGWFAKESLTLLAPDGQANVIASSEPLGPEVDLHTYASAQGELLAQEFPGYQELTFQETDLLGGSRRGYVRRFDWTPPDGEPVSQYQLYYVEGGRGYTATATSPVRAFDRYERDLIAMLSGIRLEDEQ